MTDDLVSWLRTQLDADEEQTYDPGGWRPADWEWRVADIAAKRAILDLHGWESHECPEPSDEWGPHTGYEPLCRTLRLLASARPGYRQEWKP